jgi:uncharacterized protein HemX
MAEGRPRLVAVSEPPGGGTPGAGVRRARPWGRRAVWLLAVALALAVLGWGLASREVATLSRELDAREDELARARGLLAAAEQQRALVRSHLESLAAEAAAFAGRLGELEALVASDPEPAKNPQPTGKEGERAH